MPARVTSRAAKYASHARLAGICLSGLWVLFCSCAKVRYPTYYALNLSAPVPQAAHSESLPGSVAVREFTASRFLRDGPIVYRDSPERIGFYHYHRWAVDPRSAITNALLQDLRSNGLFQSVQLFDSRAKPDYLIAGSIDHLEEVDQGRNVFVKVAVSAQLLEIKSGAVLWQDVSSQTSRLDSRSIPALVGGMSQAGDQVIAQLVSSMERQLLQLQSSASSLASKPGPQ